MSIKELEKLRKKARNIASIGILCSVALTLLFFHIEKSSGSTYIESLACSYLGTGIGICITQLISSKSKEKFTIAFKKTFVLKSLKSVFTNLNYEPEKGIDESIIRNTQMMYMGDRYYSNDYIKAKYKNINIEQADVHIVEKHERGKRTTWVTIFKGKWMTFDFNKNFKANIQVSQNGFKNSKINNWGNKLKYKKVMMEDQSFNNQFMTYAQSEHEAFYILTPSLMEKIKNLANTIDGKILLCFVDNKLHVGIQNNKDSFEHSIFTKINENKVIEKISKDIKLITNFVDELDLDNDLFRKEV